MTTDWGDAYKAKWWVRGDDVTPGNRYRLRVLASGQELGFFEVEVVASDQRPADGQVSLGSVLVIGFHLAPGVGQPADANGGTVTLAGGQVALSFPAGALASGTFITAVPAASQPPSGGPAVVSGTAWEFGPTGTQFPQPVTMTIAYDPAQIPAGTSESELRIHKLVNGTYVQQNAGVVDLVHHTVSAEVSSFSVYVVLGRLFPGSQADTTAPQIQAVEVLDPSTGQYGGGVAIDVSGSDVNLSFRITATDDISGVASVGLAYYGPSGLARQYRTCYASQPSVGSDTNGQWVCDSLWPQYGEAGSWTAYYLWMQDKVGNYAYYYNLNIPTAQPACLYPQGTPCIVTPSVDVMSTVSDLTPPTAVSLQVSLDAQPRAFGPTVSVDVGTMPRSLVFGLQATDDLTGLQGGYAQVYLYQNGPSNQSFAAGCQLVQGTSVNGFFECYWQVPQLAEQGTWSVRQVTLADRVGNVRYYYVPNGSGQVCVDQSGTSCVDAPSIQVTSAGDAVAPLLQSVALSTSGTAPDIAASVSITDDLSGTAYAWLSYQSTTTSQTQGCYAALSAGTSLNGTWSCTVTLSQYAARGQWFLQNVYLYDGAGNTRSYTRLPGSTDSLCYYDVATQNQTCTVVGPLDIIVQ